MSGEEVPHDGVGIDGGGLGTEHLGQGFGQVGPSRPLVALAADGVELHRGPTATPRVAGEGDPGCGLRNGGGVAALAAQGGTI